MHARTTPAHVSDMSGRLGGDLRPERYAMCPTYSMIQPDALASFLRVVPSLPSAYARSWSERMMESVPCEPRTLSACEGVP